MTQQELKMFDSKEDIGLLHGSLVCATYSNSASTYNKQDAVNIVHDSVKMIIKHSLSGIKEENEKFKVRLQSNEKLHAAIFFTTLRSCDIKSEDADYFYESILYNWPSVDLEFYIELNFKCDWSEYFIKCALQLPSDVLLKVLNMMLDLPVGRHVQCYLWHLIIQTIILKSFNVSYDEESEYPFNFNFSANSQFLREYCVSEFNINNKITLISNKTCEQCDGIAGVIKGIFKNHIEDKTTNVDGKIMEVENEMPDVENEMPDVENEMPDVENEITDVENEITDKHNKNNNDINGGEKNNTVSTEENMTSFFKTMFNRICENLSLRMEVSSEIEIIKVFCHGVKLLLKCIAEKNKNSRDTSQFIDFFKMFKLLQDCLESKTNHEILKAELLKCSNKFVSHTYATGSWDISLNYLTFLLSYYCNKAYSGIHSLTQFCDSETDLDSICKYVVNELVSLNAISLESDEFLKILCRTVQFGFQHSTYVAELFLSIPAIVERDDVLMVLENNCHIISFCKIYPSILDNIMKVKTQGSKLKLLNIFYKFLQGMEISMYNSVLGFILSKYGLTKEFQLPNFDDQLFEFTWRRTPTLKQAEDMLPVLFVQNPFTVVKNLIDQVLLQGSEGKPFVQIMKHFSNVCLYKEKLDDLPMLHVVLDEYFRKDKLKESELKNMNLLYEFLVEVHLETPVLSPCDFFKVCIVPKLVLDFDKMELLLECAQILVPTLLSDEYFQGNPSEFSFFIISFARLADDFIATGNGRMKVLVIDLLKKFEVYQLEHECLKDGDKVQLWSVLKDLQEVTCVYLKEFLPENIEFKTKCYVWTWCCRNKDSTFFENNFPIESVSYTSLINTLIEVLPHLTKDEWLYSINLLKICCDNHQLVDEITYLNNPFKLSGYELKIYAVVVAIVTSLHFILVNNRDKKHISSCFYKSLMNLVDQKEITHTHVLLAAFLELCYLISHVSEDLFYIFSSTLLALKKQIILSNSDVFVQTDYMKLLSNAIFCLPDSVKDYVIQNV